MWRLLQSLTTQQETVARKYFPLTGRNLEQDQAHVCVCLCVIGGGYPAADGGLGKEEEEGGKDRQTKE